MFPWPVWKLKLKIGLRPKERVLAASVGLNPAAGPAAPKPSMSVSRALTPNVLGEELVNVLVGAALKSTVADSVDSTVPSLIGSSRSPASAALATYMFCTTQPDEVAMLRNPL